MCFLLFSLSLLKKLLIYNDRYEGDNFVLDQQVVRAALKSYANILKKQDTSTLSPSNAYLRFLVQNSNNNNNATPSVSSPDAWQNPTTAILFLELRAALLVRELARSIDNPDASGSHRVGKAVTEAFVAVRVGEMIQGLPEAFEGNGRIIKVLGRLYLLVTFLTLYLTS